MPTNKLIVEIEVIHEYDGGNPFEGEYPYHYGEIASARIVSAELDDKQLGVLLYYAADSGDLAVSEVSTAIKEYFEKDAIADQEKDKPEDNVLELGD